MSDAAILGTALLAATCFMYERSVTARAGSRNESLSKVPDLVRRTDALELRYEELQDTVIRWQKRDDVRAARAAAPTGTAAAPPDIPADLLRRCGGNVERATSLYRRWQSSQARA